MNRYEYLFPFEKVPMGSKVLIYGAGDVGIEYLKQLKVTGYAECVGFADREWEQYANIIVPVYEPAAISKIEFDYVVIAMKTGIHLSGIKKVLWKQGVPEDKIIYIENRQETIVFEDSCNVILEKPTKYAFDKAAISVALKYGPGLGDCIVKKKFVTELIKMIPECRIDIYVPNIGEIVREIYADLPNVNSIINDGGALYEQNSRKYDIAMKLFFQVVVDNLQTANIALLNKIAAEKLYLFADKVMKYNLQPFPVSNNYVHFARAKYKGLNYYNYMNMYGDVFDFKDIKVSIPLNKKYQADFDMFKFGKYITINYGSGISNDNSVAKQWPYKYFVKFVQSFTEKYIDVQIVQLGTEDAVKVPGVQCYVLGKSIGLVNYILKKSLLHIDIEGGLVHLATQLGTKCVVLFGPTPVWFFGYEQNINILSGKCCNCHCLYDGFNVCAKRLSEPECMYSITPEMVMKKVDEYLGEKVSKK